MPPKPRRGKKSPSPKLMFRLPPAPALDDSLFNGWGGLRDGIDTIAENTPRITWNPVVKEEATDLHEEEFLEPALDLSVTKVIWEPVVKNEPLDNNNDHFLAPLLLNIGRKKSPQRVKEERSSLASPLLQTSFVLEEAEENSVSMHAIEVEQDGTPYVDAHAHIDLYSPNNKYVASMAELNTFYKKIPWNFQGFIQNLVFPEHVVIDHTWITEFLTEGYIMGTTIGMHPRRAADIDKPYQLKLTSGTGTMRQLIKHFALDETARKTYKVCGIGECGLDLMDGKESLLKQIEVVTWQFGIARQAGLPVVIHCRAKLKDEILTIEDTMIELIIQILGPNYPVYRHCAPQTLEILEKWLQRVPGCVFGIGPSFLRDTPPCRVCVTKIPLTRMLVETDAPYFQSECEKDYPLTPKGTKVFKRQPSNHPAACSLVITYIAKLKGKTFREIADITREGTRRFFQLDRLPLQWHGPRRPPLLKVVAPME